MALCAPHRDLVKPFQKIAKSCRCRLTVLEGPGAYPFHEETRKGRLEPGKLAGRTW